MRPFFLTSQRLGFSTWSQDDLPLALGLWGDPNVTRFTGGPLTAAQATERLSREIGNLERYNIQYWPVFLKETGEHVGSCRLRPRNGSNDTYELGFHLRREYWGRGFGREAAQAAILHSFTTLGARALYAGHHPLNDASRQLLQSLGFRYIHDEFYAPTQLMEPCYLLTPGQP
jgi:RimJ/RimL family protein N-acetyltransferase